MYLFRRTLIATALTTSIASSAARSQDTVQQRGRPIILLIHGRAQEYKVTDAMAAEWIGAARDGLRKVGLAGAIGQHDIQFLNYQFAFEPDLPGDSVCRPSERVSSQYTRSTGVSALASYLFAPGRRGAMLAFRDGLARSIGSPRVVIRALDDVNLYMTPNGAIACQVNRVVRDAVIDAAHRGRPVVIAAHSLGTLVSFRVLNELSRSHPEITIDRFVTFGSQLPLQGLPEILVGQDSLQSLMLPNVKSWVNIVGLGDPAAWAVRDNDRIDQSDRRIVELNVATDPSDQHSAFAYLKHPLTALAIGRAWCDGFSEVSRPTACSGSDRYLAHDVADSLTPFRFQRLPAVLLLAGIEDRDWRSENIGIFTLQAPLFPFTLTGRLAPRLGRKEASPGWSLAPGYSIGYGPISLHADIGGGHFRLPSVVGLDTLPPKSGASASDSARVRTRERLDYPSTWFYLGELGVRLGIGLREQQGEGMFVNFSESTLRVNGAPFEGHRVLHRFSFALGFDVAPLWHSSRSPLTLTEPSYRTGTMRHRHTHYEVLMRADPDDSVARRVRIAQDRGDYGHIVINKIEYDGDVAPWLTASAEDGSIPLLALHASTARLTRGTYTAWVTVSAPSRHVLNSPMRVKVVLEVE